MQYGYAPLVDYELRPGGTFRAYANEGMKAFGCREVSGLKTLLETGQPLPFQSGPA